MGGMNPMQVCMTDAADVCDSELPMETLVACWHTNKDVLSEECLENLSHNILFACSDELNQLNCSIDDMHDAYNCLTSPDVNGNDFSPECEKSLEPPQPPHSEPDSDWTTSGFTDWGFTSSSYYYNPYYNRGASLMSFLFFLTLLCCCVSACKRSRRMRRRRARMAAEAAAQAAAQSAPVYAQIVPPSDNRPAVMATAVPPPVYSQAPQYVYPQRNMQHMIQIPQPQLYHQPMPQRHINMQVGAQVAQVPVRVPSNNVYPSLNGNGNSQGYMNMSQ